MSAGARAYFKGLRLADWRIKAESFKLISKRPDFQDSVGGGTAFAWSPGANVRYQCSFGVAFKRGFWFTEPSASLFWDRIRTFMQSLKTVLTRAGTIPQFGPLSIVRDPDGTSTGTRDATETTGVIGPGAGITPVLANPVDWNVGDYVLVALQSDPTIYEITQVSAANHTTHEITFTLVGTYAGVADVCRLEWYWPECALTSDPEFPVNGPAAVGFVTGIELTFEGVEPTVNGGLL